MIFLGPKIIKGSPEKLLSYYFIEFFNFFTLVQVGTGQIYYFIEFINLPSINLKSFYCSVFRYQRQRMMKSMADIVGFCICVIFCYILTYLVLSYEQIV